MKADRIESKRRKVKNDHHEQITTDQTIQFLLLSTLVRRVILFGANQITALRKEGVIILIIFFCKYG